MSEKSNNNVGKITWTDLTVEDAERVKRFYSEVVGWKVESVSMGNYDDYSMTSPADNQAVAGVCHARGVNSDLPAQWLIYITVEDLDKSIARCLDLGGRIIAGPKNLGQGRYCVIQDPAGAIAALFTHIR